jgi:hypothetical protein
MTMPYGSGGQSLWEEVRSLVHPDLVHATDAAGNNFTVHVSINSFRGDTNEYGIAIQLHPLRTRDSAHPVKIPARVVWDVPVEVEDVSVAVELKNIPLP